VELLEQLNSYPKATLSRLGLAAAVIGGLLFGLGSAALWGTRARYAGDWAPLTPGADRSRGAQDYADRVARFKREYALFERKKAQEPPHKPVPIGLRLGRLLKIRSGEIYNAEQRDPVWAPAMERQLEARFSPEVFNRWPGLKAPDIECRTSTCRIEVEYTRELKNRLIAENEAEIKRKEALGENDQWLMHLKTMARNDAEWAVTALDPIFKDSGPFATSSTIVRPLEDLRETYVIKFGEKEIEPEAYASWVAGRREGYRRYRESLRLARESRMRVEGPGQP
jgi:hypothetical protein